MRPAMLLAACLLAATPALVAEPGDIFGKPGGEPGLPNRFIKVDMLDLGMLAPIGDWPAFAGHVATFTCVLDRARFGIGAIDTYTSPDFWNLTVVLPVHVGATIWSNPKATWPVWGAVPDVYVKVSGSLWQNGQSGTWTPWPPSFRLAPFLGVALCCDIDYYSLGARLDVGAYKVAWERNRVGDEIYAEFVLRGLTFGIAF
jgi:hypothetical protein